MNEYTTPAVWVVTSCSDNGVVILAVFGWEQAATDLVKHLENADYHDHYSYEITKRAVLR